MEKINSIAIKIGKYLGILLIALFLFHFLFGAYEEVCGIANKPQARECTAYNVIKFFGIGLLTFVDDNHDALIAIGTLIVAAFTGTLWRSTDKLGRMAEEQGIAMDKSISESSRAATAMEDIAKHLAVQTKATEYAIKLSQRAYVSVDNWAVTTFEVGKPVSGNYQLLNSGRLAANVVEQVVCGFIGLTIEPAPDYTAGAQIAHSVVRPGAPVNSPFNFTEILTQEQYDRIITREFCVFVWGRITYNDDFNERYQTGYAAKLVWQRIGEGGRQEWIPWFTGTPGYHYTT